jgi:hypothetical protein
MITACRYFNAPVETISVSEEEAFFSSIRLANNTFKTTAPNRMDELDALIADLAKERAWQRPLILDVGVSSGITTLNLQQAMLVNGIRPTFIATDLILNASIIEVVRGVRVLVDARGHALQVGLFGMGLRTWRRRLDLLTFYWFFIIIARLLAHRKGSVSRQDVRLVSRRLAKSQEIEFIEDDLTQRNPDFVRRFDLIRAANILNCGYFEPECLRNMIANLKAYARGPGAFVVINRTHQNGSNHGTVFKMSADGGLQAFRRVGRGSEIEDLVSGPTSYVETQT